MQINPENPALDLVRWLPSIGTTCEEESTATGERERATGDPPTLLKRKYGPGRHFRPQRWGKSSQTGHWGQFCNPHRGTVDSGGEEKHAFEFTKALVCVPEKMETLSPDLAGWRTGSQLSPQELPGLKQTGRRLRHSGGREEPQPTGNWPTLHGVRTPSRGNVHRCQTQDG